MWVCTVGLIIYQCVLDGTGAGAGVQAFKLQASSFRRGRVGVFTDIQKSPAGGPVWTGSIWTVTQPG
jgi:hypothetical protein